MRGGWAVSNEPIPISPFGKPFMTKRQTFLSGKSQVFVSAGLMQPILLPPLPFAKTSHTSKYLSDKPEDFGYLETGDPRHEPRCTGGVADKPRLSEIVTALWFFSHPAPPHTAIEHIFSDGILAFQRP